MLVLKDDGNLYHYQQENQKFLQLNISSMDFNKVLSMTIDSTTCFGYSQLETTLVAIV